MIWFLIGLMVGIIVGSVFVSLSMAQRINEDVRLKAAWTDYQKRKGDWPNSWAKKGDKDD